MAEIGTLLGRVVAGKFRIEEHIGSGAMGEVFRARHVVLDTAIALKIMRPDIAKDAMFKERFYREAKAASRLDHPNSVRVIDFGVDDDGLVYLAMEFLAGRDLLAVLRQEWPLPDDRIVDILVQTLGAVSMAHELGIVHRDLKPENIMVSIGPEDDGARPYQVKVCDFGIAKLNDPRGFQTESGKALTSTGTLIGTPEYMSPEQARGDALDARSDLYSVGIILYQMLVGKVPFSAENALGVVLKQVTDEPEPPSRLRPGVNARLEAICLRALRKSRDERYPTAREMRRDLRSVFGSRPASTSDESGGFLVGALPDDVTSAPTVVAGPAVAASSARDLHATPGASAGGGGPSGLRERDEDWAESPKKDTSTGAELDVLQPPLRSWTGAIAAVAVLALLLGAAGVVAFTRGRGADATEPRPGPAPLAASGATTLPGPLLEAPPAARTAPTSATLGASRPAPGQPARPAATGARAVAALPPSSSGPAAALLPPTASVVPSAAPPAGAAPTADPSYNPGGAHVTLGSLTRQNVREEALRARMAAALPALSECYRNALRIVGTAVGGAAELNLSIDEQGNVTAYVSAPKLLPSFVRCAQGAIGARALPASALETSGQGATASQALTLQP